MAIVMFAFWRPLTLKSPVVSIFWQTADTEAEVT